MKYNAVIIGGGAAGLMCAIAAKQKNPRLSVAIIEKNDRVGKKLLATGNGRCNLTNLHVSADKYCGSFKRQNEAVLKTWNAKRLLDYFQKLGLLTTADNEGRVYPLCRQAAAVLDVLRFNCERLGVEVFCRQTIKGIKRRGAFTVTTSEHIFSADKLVIAAGSKAAPKLGGSGSAADMLKNLGHRFVPFSPALCPVKVQSPVLKSLKGLRATGVVTLLRSEKTIKAEHGEVQFNEDNLSGICVFNLSLYTRAGDSISLDLLSDISNIELYNILLQNKERYYQQTIDNLLTGILQKRVAQAVIKSANVRDFSRICQTLGEQEIKRIADSAKNLRFTVTANDGFDRAQACRGGILGSEIDEATMHSKVCRGLSLCGEAIDLCGECGGYNLHFAFASGIIAGEHL